MAQLEQRLPELAEEQVVAAGAGVPDAAHARAARAARVAKKLGYENAQALAGGLESLARRQPAGRKKLVPGALQSSAAPADLASLDTDDDEPVKMYTTAVCPYCMRAKALLQASGVCRHRRDPRRPASPRERTR